MKTLDLDKASFALTEEGTLMITFTAPEPPAEFGCAAWPKNGYPISLVLGSDKARQLRDFMQ